MTGGLAGTGVAVAAGGPDGLGVGAGAAADLDETGFVSGGVGEVPVGLGARFGTAGAE